MCHYITRGFSLRAMHLFFEQTLPSDDRKKKNIYMNVDRYFCILQIFLLNMKIKKMKITFIRKYLHSMYDKNYYRSK